MPTRCGASTTQPVCPVQCRTSSAGIVFRKVRIAAVAEDALHEIQIADQAARRDEADLHGLLRIAAGGRTNQRPQQQRDEAARLLLLIRRERQRQQILGRTQRRGPQRRERLLRHRGLVGGNGKPAFGDVKQSLRGAPVAARIVQHALRQAVGIQVRRREGIRRHRQRHDARHAFAVQHEGVRRAAARRLADRRR